MDTKQKAWGAAVTAYVMWGFLPVYWKLLSEVPSLVVLAHRTIWSAFFLGIFLFLRRDLLRVVNYREIGFHAMSAMLLGVNWGVYIYAVSNGFILASSLGYFSSPLIYLAVGSLWFHESLSRMQRLALSLSVLAVISLAYGSDLTSMVIALLLASSIVAYGLFSRSRRLSLWAALGVESIILGIPALMYLLWGTETGFWGGEYNIGQSALLVGAGPATMIPLFFYGGAIQRLPLKIFGFLQYISPSIQFILATSVYLEPVTGNRLLAFGLVWLGICLLVISSFGEVVQRRLCHSVVPIRRKFS
jgi:chloramphenicol-sensitive protein RarD